MSVSREFRVRLRGLCAVRSQTTSEIETGQADTLGEREVPGCRDLGLPKSWSTRSCHRSDPRPGPGGPARPSSGCAHRVASRHAPRRRAGVPPGDLRDEPERPPVAPARQVQRHVLADPASPLSGATDKDAAVGRGRHVAPQPEAPRAVHTACPSTTCGDPGPQVTSLRRRSRPVAHRTSRQADRLFAMRRMTATAEFGLGDLGVSSPATRIYRPPSAASRQGHPGTTTRCHEATAHERRWFFVVPDAEDYLGPEATDAAAGPPFVVVQAGRSRHDCLHRSP